MRPPATILCLIFLGLLGEDAIFANESAASKTEALPKKYNRRVLLVDFINETGDSGTKYLSVSIPEAFSTPLVKTGRFVILNRGTVRDYEQKLGIATHDLHKEENATRLGKAIGADVVLTGKFATVGKRINVSARAVDVHGGRVSVEDSEILETNATMFQGIDALAVRMSGPMAERMQPLPTPPSPPELTIERVEAAQKAEIEKAQTQRTEKTQIPETLGVGILAFGGYNYASPALGAYFKGGMETGILFNALRFAMWRFEFQPALYIDFGYVTQSAAETRSISFSQFSGGLGISAFYPIPWRSSRIGLTILQLHSISLMNLGGVKYDSYDAGLRTMLHFETPVWQKLTVLGYVGFTYLIYQGEDLKRIGAGLGVGWKW